MNLSKDITARGVGSYESLPTVTNTILNREQARHRLQQLKPGSEEYCKLQEVLVRRIGDIAEISLKANSYKVDCRKKDHLLVGGFGSSEHIAIGMGIRLRGLPDDQTVLTKGQTKIEFPHIIALAGDFYGVRNQPVSLLGGSDEEKTRRFMAAYRTLAEANNDEIAGILALIMQEYQEVISSGLPHHCYSSQLIEKNNAIKEIKGDIDELLIDNSDHFSINAEEAYRIGHDEAIRVAAEAGRLKPEDSLEGLKTAYAIDAFACHFLTDLFSSGHVRNQRGALETCLAGKLRFSPDYAKSLAGILTGAQHEKDGKEGLEVENQKGEKWRAYGDGFFFTPQNEDNQKKVKQAIQQSANEIHEAFSHPDVRPSKQVEQLIPRATPNNPPPLYFVDQQSNELFLNQGSQRIAVTKKRHYFTKALPCALNHLPEAYINGFIKGALRVKVSTNAILNKVVIAQRDRFTDSIWHVVGIATHHQVQREAEKVNDKIDEMAVVLKASYQISQSILQLSKDVSDKIDKVSASQDWHAAYGEIQDSVARIMDIEDHLPRYNSSDLQNKLGSHGMVMHEAYERISRVLRTQTGTGKKILNEYKKMIEASQKLSPSRSRILVTIWFRRLIDLQIKAFNFYLASRVMNQGEEVSKEMIQGYIENFEKDLKRQIKTNIEFIDPDLACQSERYLAIQYSKSEKRDAAFSDILADE